MGFTSNKVKKEKNNVLKLFVGRLLICGREKKENIVTARITDGENPEINANPQSNIRSIKVFRKDPLRSRSIGDSNQDKIQKRIPTCSPETAKIWIAPAAA